MHTQIIISHNLVTEIKEMLTCRKICKQIVFHQDRMSKITVGITIHPMMQELSPCLRPNLKTIWSFAAGYMQGWKLTGSTGLGFSNGDETRVVAGSKRDMLLFDGGLAELNLICQLHFPEVPCGICNIPWKFSIYSKCSPVMSVELAQYHHPFAVEQRQRPSLWMWCTTYLFCGSNGLHPPVPVVSICQASSVSATTSPCGAEPFWWLCPSPSWVRHLRSGFPALSLHHPYLRHAPNCRNIQDHSDSVG